MALIGFKFTVRFFWPTQLKLTCAYNAAALAMGKQNGAKHGFSSFTTFAVFRFAAQVMHALLTPLSRSRPLSFLVPPGFSYTPTPSDLAQLLAQANFIFYVFLFFSFFVELLLELLKQLSDSFPNWPDRVERGEGLTGAQKLNRAHNMCK